MNYQEQLKTVREIAKEYADIVTSERHAKMHQRFKDINDLKIVRPPLNMDEIPWHEMNINHELDCICEDPFFNAVEAYMRRIIYCEKHFKCDNLVPAYWQVPKAYMSTGNGFAVDENYIKTDDNNNIVSHCYHDVLPDEKSLEKFHLPVITAYPDADKQNMDRAEEIFNGILPVRLTGHGIYYAPWDTISRLRGVDNILIDIYDKRYIMSLICSIRFRLRRSALIHTMVAVKLCMTE